MSNPSATLTCQARRKAVYAMHLDGKTHEEIGAVFHISRSRVGQIILAHKQTLAVQQNRQHQDDPLMQAYSADRISTRFYRKLIKAGYGSTFDYAQLCTWCRENNQEQLFKLKAFGKTSLDTLYRLCGPDTATCF